MDICPGVNVDRYIRVFKSDQRTVVVQYALNSQKQTTH